MSSGHDTNARSAPLRVLHVVSGDLWAGAESQFFQLVSAMHERPELSVRAAIMNPGILADRLRARGVTVDLFDERRESTLKITRRLCRIAREWRPAVIHTHRRKEHVVGGVAALASGARAVATIHGRREFSHPWWQIRQSFLSALEHNVLAHVHYRIIAVSAEMAGHLPGRKEKTVVIPNGIDIAAIRSAGNEQRPTLPGKPGGRLAFVGRLEPVKRVERIVETLAVLHATDPGAWSLFIIGEGSSRAAIEARIRACGLGEHVHMLGFLPDPLPWLAQMDALVFASDHEGLPMTALEALALGVPVVSPAVGGLTDLVQEAGTGRIATSSDPEALAESIRITVAAGRDLNQNRSSAVPRRYTIEQSTGAHIDLYREVAGVRTRE